MEGAIAPTSDIRGKMFIKIYSDVDVEVKEDHFHPLTFFMIDDQFIG